MCEPVHHEVTQPPAPDVIYRAYLSSKEHAAFTGQAARMSTRVGGTFTCGDESISGVNVDLEPGKRIVQAWRLNYWKSGVYSLVSFTLTKKGRGTKLVLDHIGIPPEERGEIDSGWTQYYWDPLREYLGRP
jgi:activator of HSP90 ATPase